MSKMVSHCPCSCSVSPDKSTTEHNSVSLLNESTYFNEMVKLIIQLLTHKRSHLLHSWMNPLFVLYNTYVFFRADTQLFRSSRPITDIYVWCEMKINFKIKNNMGFDKNCL